LPFSKDLSCPNHQPGHCGLLGHGTGDGYGVAACATRGAGLVMEVEVRVSGGKWLFDSWGNAGEFSFQSLFWINFLVCFSSF